MLAHTDVLNLGAGFNLIVERIERLRLPMKR